MSEISVYSQQALGVFTPSSLIFKLVQPVSFNCPNFALALKVNSIEVDVAWYKNQIKVSHLNLFLKNKPNFDDLYLKPLFAKKDSLQSVKFLFVDIKSGGEDILVALNKLIAQYPDIFSTRIEDNSQQIKVVISGAVDRIDLYNNYKLNYLFIDGRMSYISLKFSTNIMPVISANYASLNINERKSLIQKAHKQNKLVRFWHTSDNTKTWENLFELGVDIIGVDKLVKFKFFLDQR